MAYDFGSQTLGIKNPFKVEGLFYSIAGLLISAGGILPLLKVADLIKTEPVTAYGYAALGTVLVLSGGAKLKTGLFSLFRFFVGRSVPTSLSYNFSPSEKDVAQSEKVSLLYDSDNLHSMLMGRKNTTFIEPQGWVGRFIHSIVPKLTFLPYPLRNLAQEVGAMAINIVTALLGYLVCWFVISSGLAGEIAQDIMMPVISLLLMLFLVISWTSSANSISGSGRMAMRYTGGVSFASLLVLCILVPIGSGFALESLNPSDINDIQQFFASTELFEAGPNLAILVAVIGIVMAAVLTSLVPRIKKTTPSTDVAEWRDNFQESVHPNEIFINIENIVLANRRYREIPNRVYREWQPTLDEQSDGKGAFNGTLMIETQPEYTYEEQSKATKICLTAVSALFLMASAVLLYFFGTTLIEVINGFMTGEEQQLNEAQISAMVPNINSALLLFFAYLTVRAASKILIGSSHLMWGELHFNSLLMYMKTEGTYAESKVSTGMAIHDSTRSENTVVRSSITPWVMTSRIHTSTFATTGIFNLESPRYILSMSKNEEELNTIRDEIKAFLKDRENIASITSERDLQNASTLHQVNQQTRATEMVTGAPQKKLTQIDEEAAGYLRNQENTDKD